MLSPGENTPAAVAVGQCVFGQAVELDLAAVANGILHGRGCMQESFSSRCLAAQAEIDKKISLCVFFLFFLVFFYVLFIVLHGPWTMPRTAEAVRLVVVRGGKDEEDTAPAAVVLQAPAAQPHGADAASMSAGLFQAALILIAIFASNKRKYTVFLKQNCPLSKLHISGFCRTV